VLIAHNTGLGCFRARLNILSLGQQTILKSPSSLHSFYCSNNQYRKSATPFFILNANIGLIYWLAEFLKIFVLAVLTAVFLL
jgi:hypothetical protein